MHKINRHLNIYFTILLIIIIFFEIINNENMDVTPFISYPCISGVMKQVVTQKYSPVRLEKRITQKGIVVYCKHLRQFALLLIYLFRTSISD
jgi:hypothetical protein